MKILLTGDSHMILDPPISQLADGSRLLAVESGEIPAPADAEHPGLHLFVNCLYPELVDRLPAESLLVDARADALFLLRFLVANKRLENVVSVCITFYADAIPRRRLYRYSIFTALISSDERAIDESYFLPAEGVIRSSQRSDVARLLTMG